MLFETFRSSIRPLRFREYIIFAVPRAKYIVIVAPLFGFVLTEMTPSHLARHDLIAVRVVDVFLEELHVFLRLLILLLEKPLPIVLIPSAVWIVLGHNSI